MIRTSEARWRNLGAAAGGLAAALFAVFDLYQWALAYAGDKFHNDFTFYYAAARIGLAHGWGSIYNLGLQQSELTAMGSGITIAQLARFISPPPVAWLAVPFTPLPYPIAYWIWSALLVGALAVVCVLAAPGNRWIRLIFFAAAIGWLPVIYSLQLGQPGMFVALGVAGCYVLLRDRPLWAGAALGAVVLKPQLAFLVPAALLAARRDRAFLGSVIAIGGLGAASLIAVGPSGVTDYLSRLNFASSVSVNRELTLAAVFGDATITRIAEAAIAAWTLLLVYRLRHRQAEWIFVAALAGGMLATPYAHLDDLAMFGLAAFLYLRMNPPAWTWIYVLAFVLVVEGEPIWGPAPVIVAEVSALALVSAAALTSHAGRPLQQIDARPLEIRPTR